MSKYEQLIEYIINENESKARELFHQIVVEKSRDIYESLIDEQDLEEIGGNQVDQMVDEITADEEGMDEGEDSDVEVDDEDDTEDDTEDGMDMDMDMDDHHADVGGNEGLEDRVMDLEDALDELKAEFDSLMGQEAGEAHADMEMDMGDHVVDEDEMAEMGMMEAEDDEEDEEEDLDESRSSRRKMTETEWLREYVDKIGDVYSQEPAKGEGNEVGKGGKATVTAKSVVAGKNDMGGSTQNIARGGAEQNPDNKPVPQPNNQYSKGKGDLKGAGQFKNVPGGDAGKTSYKTKEGEYSTEHGKEGETTGGKVTVDKKSILKRIGK